MLVVLVLKKGKINPCRFKTSVNTRLKSDIIIYMGNVLQYSVSMVKYNFFDFGLQVYTINEYRKGDKN